MAGILPTIVSLTLGVILTTSVLIPTLKGVNTSEWSTSELALWSIATLGAIIGIVYGILSAFGVA